MLKRMALGASALLVLVGVRAQAAAPQLPANAISSDTTIVSFVDGSTLTPDAMRQAAAAVLGANSPNVAQLNTQIDRYKEKYDKAVAAGVDSMMMVARTSGKGNNGAGAGPMNAADQGILYVHLKPGADANSVQKMITDEMQPDQRGKTAFEHQGDFLLMHDKAAKVGGMPDATRAKTFAEAISHSGNAAVVVAFVPDASVREEANKNQQAGGPPWLRDAMMSVANSKWASLSVTFGKSPAISMTNEASDAGSAAKLTDSINAGLAQLKQAAQNPNAAGPGPMAMFAPMLAPLADALKPAQQGNSVTVTLNGQSLAMIANTVAQFAPMLGAGGGPNGQGRGPRPRPGGQ